VWQLGAEQGLVNCQNALGGLYLKENNLEQAQHYFKLAADKGHARAATELGKLFWGRVQQALTVNEDHAPFTSGMVHYFSIGMGAGQHEAYWGLSLCYENGHGVAQCHNRARELLHRAAQGNHPQALCRLGDHYRLGLGGIDPHPALALRFYGSAADLGLCSAQFNFGVMHLLGKGVVVNEDLGTKYIFLAGQQGHHGALYIMGDLLYHGKAGLPKKPDEAEKYLQQAALLGNAEAAQDLVRYGMKPAN
jgi:TPR repeat protein